MSRLLINYILIIAVLSAVWVYSDPGRDQQSAADFHDNFQAIANALEAYALDNNGRYPPSQHSGFFPTILSTPIAYISRKSTFDRIPPSPSYRGISTYWYRNLQGFQAESTERKLYGSWIVASQGYTFSSWPTNANLQVPPVLYDATNGLLSSGVIFRSQRISLETGL